MRLYDWVYTHTAKFEAHRLRKGKMRMSVTEKLNGYGPLAGIKVVEVCTYVAAPATVRVLSEMGAEIIKVESFAGDTQRTQGPGFGCELTETEDPTIDLNNTNKNWVSLNLKTEEGLTILKKLIADADVFMTVERCVEKLGLDYPTLSKEFPNLIWAQMRGYGEFGEFCTLPRLRRGLLGPLAAASRARSPEKGHGSGHPAASLRRLQRRHHDGGRHSGARS